jgi:hypothetical protein
MKRAILAVSLLLLSAGPASAQQTNGDIDAVTNQNSWPLQCDTVGNLPAGTFSQVSSGLGNQPCSNRGQQGDADDTCDSTTDYTYLVHGHLTFGAPSSGTTATQVEVQVFGTQGNGPGSVVTCTGGATVTCTIPPSGGEYSASDDSLFNTQFSGGSKISVPIDVNSGSLGPMNALGFYVFAKPIGGSLRCTANNFTSEEQNGQ